MEIWIVLCEAHGKFTNVKNWPPHVIAKHKRITHEFTRSSLDYPPTEESKRALSFLNLYQERGGTQQHDGPSGDKLVGVVVCSAGSVRNAVPWWMRHVNTDDAMATSFRPVENRYATLPSDFIEAERSRWRANWYS